MGAFSSRNRNAAVEQQETTGNSNAYKFPPRSGNFFGSHFIMGGERFDTPQPEAYLFGENADLNFLGNRPSAFPYPPPQANEPTKTLKSLVNIRKESVRLVRVLQEKQAIITNKIEQVDGSVLSSLDDPITAGNNITQGYNIEFVFDSDAKCAITIYYFCTEEVSPSGVTLIPQDGLTSETYHYEKGINQLFSQTGHIFNPQIFSEDDLTYNAGKEQYPLAIHCVVEEGNEECRQSHTTICVIDHHADSNSYVLRALKQKIFVDGLCYLLQEIYGIENKAINKSSVDEDLDDHGSECVICMSETRDTLILPCRHLCLCNSCADSLRYQANNCPICRAPFRALLQIRAVQKGISSRIMHQNTPTSTIGDTAPCDQNVPPGYMPVSLIEALNGPLQFMTRTRPSETDVIDGVATISSADNGKISPVKVNSHRKNKKKHASTSTSTNDIGMTTLSHNSDNVNATAAAENDQDDNVDKSEQNSLRKSDKMKIVNERAYTKSKSKANSNNINNNCSMRNEAEDEDSENEKLSPLLSQTQKQRNSSSFIKLSAEADAEKIGYEMKTNLPRRNSVANETAEYDDAANRSEMNKVNAVQDTDCSPENVKKTNYADRHTVGFKSSLKGGVNAGISKKTLHTKSTSAGNIMTTPGGADAAATAATKTNVVSSLPDMLDSPITSNATSTRSSSDSYSSSSSTKQLLTNIPPANAANIIIDEKTALQNAVNV